MISQFVIKKKEKIKGSMKSELENKKKLHHSKQKVQRQSFQEEEDIQQRVSV